MLCLGNIMLLSLELSYDLIKIKMCDNAFNYSQACPTVQIACVVETNHNWGIVPALQRCKNRGDESPKDFDSSAILQLNVALTP